MYNIKIWLTLADSLRLQIKTQSGGPASVIQLVIQEILQHLLLWLVLIISFAHSSGSTISLTPSLSPSRTHSSVSLCCILGIPESWFSSRCFSSWQKHWTDQRQKKTEWPQNGNQKYPTEVQKKRFYIGNHIHELVLFGFIYLQRQTSRCIQRFKPPTSFSIKLKHVRVVLPVRE